MDIEKFKRKFYSKEFKEFEKELKLLVNEGFITREWNNDKKDYVFELTEKGKTITDFIDLNKKWLKNKK